MKKITKIIQSVVHLKCKTNKKIKKYIKYIYKILTSRSPLSLMRMSPVSPTEKSGKKINTSLDSVSIKIKNKQNTKSLSLFLNIINNTLKMIEKPLPNHRICRIDFPKQLKVGGYKED